VKSTIKFEKQTIRKVFISKRSKFATEESLLDF